MYYDKVRPMNDIELIPGNEYIRIIGCDDETIISVGEFNDAQRVTIEKLCRLSQENSESQCQPEIYISRAVEITSWYGENFVGFED